MTYHISKSVGRNASLYGGNRPEDCETVRTMLQRIPEKDGGSTAIQPGGLEQAIRNFQAKHFPGQVLGFIIPNGPSWKKMLSLLGESAPPGPVPGASKTFNARGFSQGDAKWKRQKLNNASPSSDHDLWHDGCLLTCIASAFAWKGVTIPKDDQKAVKDKLAEKNPGYSEPIEKLTPATLEAWMCLSNSQGYASRNSVNLDAGKLSRIASRADLKFLGCHNREGVTLDYLKGVPTADQMRRWINAEQILIVQPTFDTHHWLWITGHNGKDDFSVWDVGLDYKTVTAEQVNLLNRGDQRTY